MPQLLLMVIVAVALHLLLGWPLLAGIAIAAAVLTLPGLIKLFVQVNDENRTGCLRNRVTSDWWNFNRGDYRVRGGGSRPILRGTSDLVTLTRKPISRWSPVDLERRPGRLSGIAIADS
jgi:hypothetical protein